MTPTPPSTQHTLQDTIDALTTHDLLQLIAELAGEVSNRYRRTQEAQARSIEAALRREQAEVERNREFLAKYVRPVARPVSDTNGSDPRAVDTQLDAMLGDKDG